MASPSVTSRLQLEFKLPPEVLQSLLPFLENDVPAPYVARYESEIVQGMDEDTLRALRARLEVLDEIERRKEAMIQTLEQAGKMTPALKNRIESTYDRAKLEDYFRPFRPWRQNQAAHAVVMGLSPFAEKIARGDLDGKTLAEAAEAFVDADKGLPTADAVLDATLHLVAQWIADDPYVRAHVRDEMRKRGRFVSKSITQDKGLLDRYKDVAHVNDPVNQISPQRYYTLRRAEREKAVRVEIHLEEEPVLAWIDARYLDGERGAKRRRHRKGHDDARPGDSDHTTDEIDHLTEEGDHLTDDESVLSNVATEGDLPPASQDAKTTEESGYDVPIPGDLDDSTVQNDHESADESVDGGATMESELVATEETAPDEISGSDPEVASEEAPASEDDAVPAAQERHVPHGVEEVEAPGPPAPPESPLEGEAREFMARAVREAYQRQIFGACEIDVRTEIKEKADHEYLRMLSRILRGFLLTPPFGARPVLGIDPGLRANSKIAVVSATGAILHQGVLPLRGDEKAEGARSDLAKLIEEHGIQAFAVGNGTHARQAGVLLRQWARDAGWNVELHVVDEAGLQTYASSKEARERFAGFDTRTRAAACLALRLQDPLREVVQIDARQLGLATFQNDVGRGRLQRVFDDAYVSAVHRVGVDLESAPFDVLRRVAGVGDEKAKELIALRSSGSLTNLAALESVLGDGYSLAVGFLRLGGDAADPLDRTAIHPAWRPVVERMSSDLQVPMADLVGSRDRIRSLNIDPYYEEFGRGPVELVRRELEFPWRDVRGHLRHLRPKDDVQTIEDVQEGMEFEGIVTNLTSFGVFVDLGIAQEGLVHISELNRRFVRDPRELLRVGDMVRVRILSVDRKKERIGLSMRPPERSEHGPRGRGPAPRDEARGQAPRRPPRERGPVRAASARRDGLVTGREDDARGRGRGGPGGRSGGGPRGAGGRGGGARGGGSGDRDRQGAGRSGARSSGGRGGGGGGGGPRRDRGSRQDFRDRGDEMTQTPEIRRPGWNPFRSFFQQDDDQVDATTAATDEVKPQSLDDDATDAAAETTQD
ncbi:MAG: S1 RNA-binding domain-containing protein [Planctomycetes bacterium]|nr:S1 RNA-binding domain-containing protein [Planctomycetota bacterium]MCB9891554.1 S1 RNA-binding domain-containing protein [Planctomycetota bacterium]